MYCIWTSARNKSACKYMKRQDVYSFAKDIVPQSSWFGNWHHSNCDFSSVALLSYKKPEVMLPSLWRHHRIQNGSRQPTQPNYRNAVYEHATQAVMLSALMSLPGITMICCDSRYSTSQLGLLFPFFAMMTRRQTSCLRKFESGNAGTCGLVRGPGEGWAGVCSGGPPLKELDQVFKVLSLGRRCKPDGPLLTGR